MADENTENRTYENLKDENDDMFSLLGVSDSDRKKVRDQLKEEDRQIEEKKRADMNNDDLKNAAEAEALDYIKRARQEGMDPQDTESYSDQKDPAVNSQGSEEKKSGTDHESADEEQRLDDMLDDIFSDSGDKESGSSDSDASGPDTVKTEESDSDDKKDSSEKVPDHADEDEAQNTDSAQTSDNSESLNESDTQVPARKDPMDELNDILSGVDSGRTAAEQPEGSDETSDDVMDTDHSAAGSFPGGIEISPDIMGDVDLSEDLTKGTAFDAEDILKDPANEKKRKKKEAREEKKARKKAEKELKKQLKAEKKDGSVPDITPGGDSAASEEAADKTDSAADLKDSVLKNSDNLTDDVSEYSDPHQQSDSETVKKPMTFGQKLSLALFGPPEDDESDEPSPEELAAIEKKKQAKALKKEESKQKKQDKKLEKDQKKSKAREMAVVKKAAAQEKKEKVAREEEEEDAKEKKINPRTVGAVFAILILLVVTVVFGTDQFNYHMVIHRASTYFEMQRYKKAYDQIVGVDVKNRDQEIRDKIYCVMYVQQQLDSYRSYEKLEMYEDALDSLIKGLRKYNAHIEEARELGIQGDLDGLRAQIVSILLGRFNLTEDQVNSWMQLDQDTYTQTVRDYVAGLNLQPLDDGIVLR